MNQHIIINEEMKEMQDAKHMVLIASSSRYQKQMQMHIYRETITYEVHKNGEPSESYTYPTLESAVAKYNEL